MMVLVEKAKVELLYLSFWTSEEGQPVKTTFATQIGIWTCVKASSRTPFKWRRNSLTTAQVQPANSATEPTEEKEPGEIPYPKGTYPSAKQKALAFYEFCMWTLKTMSMKPMHVYEPTLYLYFLVRTQRPKANASPVWPTHSNSVHSVARVVGNDHICDTTKRA